jgi:hypothetical protein
MKVSFTALLPKRYAKLRLLLPVKAFIPVHPEGVMAVEAGNIEIIVKICNSALSNEGDNFAPFIYSSVGGTRLMKTVKFS